MKVNELFKKMSKSLESKPELLIGAGIAGCISSVVMACKATIKANEIVEEMKENLEEDEELNKVEVVKETWKCYLPTVLTLSSGTACILAGTNIMHKKNAMLAASACAMAENLKTYAEKTEEIFGKDGAKKVRKEVAKEKASKSTAPDKEKIIDNQVIVDGVTNCLCLDALSGIYFYSNMERLKEIENLLNKRMLLENYVMLNEFYEELGINGGDIGDMLTWCVEDGYIDLEFTSELTSDGRLAMVVSHGVLPKPCELRYFGIN